MYEDYEEFDDGYIESQFDMVVQRIQDKIDELATEDKNYSYIVNPKRVQDFIYVYKLIKAEISGIPGVCLTHDLDPRPMNRSGSIEIIAKDISFANPAALARAISLSDSFEVGTRVDGTVWLIFDFRHVVEEIEDK